MEEALIENARMREFIEKQGLTGEYQSYLAAYEKEREDLSSPPLYVEYTKIYSRRGRDEAVNITPWIRGASFDQMARLAGILRGWDGTMSEIDREFLHDIVTECADEGEQEWISRASTLEFSLYGTSNMLIPLLESVRSQDHHLLLPLLQEGGSNSKDAEMPIKSPQELTRSATLDDLEALTQSPVYFHVRIGLKSDAADANMREMAIRSISTKADDRHLVLGRIPNGANPVIVREDEIAAMVVVFD